MKRRHFYILNMSLRSRTTCGRSNPDVHAELAGLLHSASLRSQRHFQRVARAIIFCGIYFAAITCAVADVDTLFVVAGSHLDIGFTNLPSTEAALRVKIFDEAINAAKHDPDFHWIEEGGWVFEQWMKSHRNDKGMHDALDHFLKNGQISVSAAYLTPHTAVIPELQRMLTVHCAELAKEFSYRPDVAILNDVPSHPQAIVDALAAKGVKYLLIGANMTFALKSFPENLVRSPFYWESEHGKKILTFIDPNNYCGSVQLFGLGPECAQVFNPKRFPKTMGPMDVMREGLADLMAYSPKNFDAQVIQQAYDNWGTECAQDLLRYSRTWNESGGKPFVKLVNPDEYFQHIEAKYKNSLPVYRAEWGGQWDEIRAMSPVWTWRIRQAAKKIAAHPSHDGNAAVLLAMDHNVHLGEIWPKFFDEKDVRGYASEVEAMFRDAVKHGITDRAALTAVPPKIEIPESQELTPEWSKLIAATPPLQVRCGVWPGKPFIANNAPPLKTPVQYGVDSNTIAMNIHLDRRALPGAEKGNVSVVVEIPLNAPIKKLRIAPEGSPAALRNKWLRQPEFIIAPDGVRVIGLPQELTIHSPLIFSWVLVADASNPNITWLQGMIVRQTLFCQLKGGATKVLPFDAWYPGEPAVIDAGIEIGKKNKN